MVDGVLAEYALLNETGAIEIPSILSFDEAATLPCAALTAWNAVVEAGQIKAGETIAVLGTGVCLALHSPLRRCMAPTPFSPRAVRRSSLVPRHWAPMH